MDTMLQELSKGIPLTLWVALGAWMLSCLFGLVFNGIARSRMKSVRAVGDFLIILVRGMPQLVALFVIYFGLVQYVQLSPVTASILTFGVVGAPFASEIFRGALTTVEHGQRDAAESIGLSRWKTLIYVVVPQAARFSVAPLINLFIGMLNLSSVAAAIGVSDVIARAQFILGSSSSGSTFIEVTVGVCVIYLGLVLPVSAVSRVLERHLSRGVGARGQGVVSAATALTVGELAAT